MIINCFWIIIFVVHAPAITRVRIKVNHILLNSKSSEVVLVKTRGTKKKIAKKDHSMTILQIFSIVEPMIFIVARGCLSNKRLLTFDILFRN